MILPDIDWVRYICIIGLYFLFYFGIGIGFRYYPKGEDDDYYQGNNFYFVSIDPWLKNRCLRFLLWKLNGSEYPCPMLKTKYVNYRELQFAIIMRTLTITAAILNTVLIFCKVPKDYECIEWYAVLFAALKLMFLLAVRHDLKRLKRYKYTVAEADETVAATARRVKPATWAINNLLEVFFYLGEARIRYCEPQNYLVYKLKNGKLMYIFLKSSFETMPEPVFDPKEVWVEHSKVFLRNYNNAVAISVDEIVIVDAGAEESASEKLKDIKPQDLPERIC